MLAPEAPLNRLPIRVRGYAARTSAAPAEQTGPNYLPDIGPSEWVLVFDCETRTTPDQNLTFGAYQLRYRGRLVDAGLFYDPEVVRGDDLAMLYRGQAEARRLRPLEPCQVRRRESFVKRVLFRAHDLGAMIVGFNLPFDLSRLAIKQAASARGGMKGGFSFQVHPWEGERHIRVKHLSRRMALIDVTEGAGRSRRDSLAKLNLKPARRGGYFVDVKTLAGALLGGSFSLEKLGSLLGIEHPKIETDSLGLPLTPDQVRYGMRDVQATWECFEALAKRYADLGLCKTPIHRIYSEAGLGKAYLKEMGIEPWNRVQREFPPQLIGKLMSAYYGGRAEVRIRRVETEVLYCDFLSMYPTVCTLMQLWPFVISTGVQWSDATAWTREFLQRVSPDDLQDPKLWPELNVLIQVSPEDDVFPIRARYGADAGVSGASATIGVNRLTGPEPLWFTLADCIAAKFLGDGKPPKVLEAVRFTAGSAQEGLAAVDIAGKPEYRVDPTRDDFYKRVIELRRAVKREAATTTGDNAGALKADQNALKLLANSTSYGIFIELNLEDRDRPERLVVHSYADEPHEVMSDKVEKPGRYFHPLLGVMITGAARLMLALAEHRATASGLDWVFCDTDSLAIARPQGMSRETFREAAFGVCDWFKPLNPYEEPDGAERPSILQVEDANFAPGRAGDRSALEPLFAFAISAKRYALYNVRGDDFELRKASAHGLGQLVEPYADPDKAARIDRLGVELWQEDLWKRVVTAARSGDPGRVRHSDPRLAAQAATRFAATTPTTLKWFKSYNALPSRAERYPDQVKPFNFLLTYQPKSELRMMAETEGDAPMRSRRSPALPASAFHKEPAIGARDAFDRKTGKPISPGDLQSVAQSLRGYHRHEERKFLGGELDDIGHTRRRHVLAVAVECIGKEGEGYGEPEAEDEEEPLAYPMPDEMRHKLAAIICAASDRHGQREYRAAAKVSDRTLREAAKADPKVNDATMLRLVEVADLLDHRATLSEAEIADLLAFARDRRKHMKLGDLAAELGEDPGNVSRVLNGKRPPYPQFLRAVQRLKASLA